MNQQHSLIPIAFQGIQKECNIEDFRFNASNPLPLLK